MISSTPLVWTVFGLTLLSVSFGQTIHQVAVGVAGSFYDPAVVTAEVGDIISFSFGGLFHGVTQSEFNTPCIPLQGGFSSGLAGLLNNASGPVPVWNLVVTNASNPIWFFCPATQPESHCNAGMVGAINAPISMFNSYQAAAKTVTGTPMPMPTVVLSGQGAFATNSPTATATGPITTATGSITTAAPSGLSTQAPFGAQPSSTPTQSSGSKMALGAIIGAVIGGVAVIAFIIGMIYFIRTRRRSQSRRSSVTRKQDEDKHLHGENSPPIIQLRRDVNTGYPVQIAPPGLVIDETIPAKMYEPATIQRLPSERSLGDRTFPRPLPHPGSANMSAAYARDSSPVDINSLARQVAVLIRPDHGGVPPESYENDEDGSTQRSAFRALHRMPSPGPPRYGA